MLDRLLSIFRSRRSRAEARERLEKISERIKEEDVDLSDFQGFDLLDTEELFPRRPDTGPGGDEEMSLRRVRQSLGR